MSVNVHEHRPVFIPAAGIDGLLGVPEGACAIVILAHGGATGRMSPRNNQLAEGLRGAGLGTLLLDLLTQREEKDVEHVADIGLLARRLAAATQWLAEAAAVDSLPVGYLGADTGAAAALRAASLSPRQTGAIVSYGGRLDLAGSPTLSRVRAPTQLIVGALDQPGIVINREAMKHLRCEHELIVVPDAHHRFEDPGAIDSVVGHAARWFRHQLA